MSHPNWFVRRAMCAAWLCVLTACSEGSPPALDVRAQSVIGGEPAPACAWPSTVRVNGATTCTGTLIHPRIVTTAAHCLDGEGSSATIIFGPGRNTGGGFALTATCHAGARGESGVNTRNDWGYCVLPDDERLEHVPITQPLVGCEAERFLKAGAHAWVVGFGDTRGTSPDGKNQVEVEINQLDKLSPGTIDVGDAQVGACHGDSGGPIYLQLKDGADDYGFRVFGSTSGPGARFCDCNCSSTYVNIANHVAQIEQREDIDVTPCTDDDGNWDPGPGCNQQLADPQHGTGTWPACEVALTTTPVASCGAAFEPDAGPPDAGAPEAGTGGNGGIGGSAAAGTGGAAGTAGSGVIAPSGGMGGTFGPSGGAGGAGGVAPTTGSAGTAVPAGGAIAGSAPGSGFGAAGSSAPPPALAGSFAPAPAATPRPDSSGCACSAVGGPQRGHTPEALALLFMISSCLVSRRHGRGRHRF